MADDLIAGWFDPQPETPPPPAPAAPTDAIDSWFAPKPQQAGAIDSWFSSTPEGRQKQEQGQRQQQVADTISTLGAEAATSLNKVAYPVNAEQVGKFLDKPEIAKRYESLGVNADEFRQAVLGRAKQSSIEQYAANYEKPLSRSITQKLPIIGGAEAAGESVAVIDAAKRLNEDKASPEDLMTLGRHYADLDAEKKRSFLDKVGNLAASTPALVAEIALTGGGATVGKAVAEKALSKVTANLTAQAVGRFVAGTAGRVVSPMGLVATGEKALELGQEMPTGEAVRKAVLSKSIEYSIFGEIGIPGFMQKGGLPGRTASGMGVSSLNEEGQYQAGVSGKPSALRRAATGDREGLEDLAVQAVAFGGLEARHNAIAAGRAVVEKMTKQGYKPDAPKVQEAVKKAVEAEMLPADKIEAALKEQDRGAKVARRMGLEANRPEHTWPEGEARREFGYSEQAKVPAPPEPPPQALEARPAALEATPAEVRPGGNRPKERTYEAVQRDIDRMEDDLIKKGDDITKLHLPGEPTSNFPPGWKQMPKEMADLYKERDAIGAKQLDQSRNEIRGVVEKSGLKGDEADIVLNHFAVDPKKSGAFEQYQAATYTGHYLGKDPKKLTMDVALTLAIKRGERIDELKDISKQTVQDAAAAVKAVRDYFGVQEAAPKSDLSERPPATFDPAALSKLSNRHRKILDLFAETGNEAETARRIGVSRERVRQIKNDIAAKLGVPAERLLAKRVGAAVGEPLARVEAAKAKGTLDKAADQGEEPGSARKRVDRISQLEKHVDAAFDAHAKHPTEETARVMKVLGDELDVAARDLHPINHSPEVKDAIEKLLKIGKANGKAANAIRRSIAEALRSTDEAARGLRPDRGDAGEAGAGPAAAGAGDRTGVPATAGEPNGIRGAGGPDRVPGAGGEPAAAAAERGRITPEQALAEAGKSLESPAPRADRLTERDLADKWALEGIVPGKSTAMEADFGPDVSPAAKATRIEAAKETLRTGLHAVQDNWAELAGVQYPRTARLSEESANSMSRYISAKIFAERAAPVFIDRILGDVNDYRVPTEQLTPKDRVAIGKLFMTTFYELRFRWARNQYQDKANQLDDAANTNPKATPQQRDAWRAEAGKFRKLAEELPTFIGGENSELGTERRFQETINNKGFKEFMSRWEETMVPVMDKFFRMAENMQPEDPIDSLSQLPGLPFNAKAIREGDTVPQDQIVKTTGGRAGNLLNLKAGKLGFARQFTGQSKLGYDVDPAAVIRHSLDRSAELARKAEMFRQLESDGLLQWGEKGQKYMFGDKAGVVLPDVNPPRGTQVAGAKEVNAVIHPDVASEVKKALDLNQPWRKLPGADMATGISLASLVEATTHTKNLMTAVFKPEMSLIDIAKNFYGVIRQDPKFMREAADLAELGMMKPLGQESTGKLPLMKSLGIEKYDPTLYLSKVSGKVLDVVDTAIRLSMSHAFDKMVAKDRAVAGEFNKRNFVNQLGQYNRRAQNWVVQALRDTGFGAFATAGSNYTVQGLRGLFLSPGVKATSLGASVAMRADMLARVGAMLGGVAVANYLLTNRVDGDDNTPIGSLWLGKHNGKTMYFDFAALAGLPRGARSIGLLALLEGKRVGANEDAIGKRMREDVIGAALHPAEGPALSFIQQAATGKNAIGMPIAPDVSRKGFTTSFGALGRQQVFQDVLGALKNMNPMVAAAFGFDRPRSKTEPDALERLFRMIGPFAPKTREKPPGDYRETITIPKRK